MARISAGLLMYRRSSGQIEVFLVHPGGPYWRNKDRGAWSIPKGELDEDESPLDAARREFEEETGVSPGGALLELTPVRQRGGKTILAWAFEGDCDPEAIASSTFEIEWPPRSGRSRRFPEIDRAGFFDLAAAGEKLNPGQRPLLDELAAKLAAG